MQDRLGLEDVDRDHAGPAAVERGDERAFLDQLGARGVDDERRRLHSRQRVELDDAARAFGQAQMQREHVGGLEQRVAALGRVVAFGDGAAPARFAAPDDDVHAECLAVAGDELADLAEAPDAERLALERHADAEVGRHPRRLQPRLLPGAVLERADVVRQAPRSARRGRRASRPLRRRRCRAGCRCRRRCAGRRDRSGRSASASAAFRAAGAGTGCARGSGPARRRHERAPKAGRGP